MIFSKFTHSRMNHEGINLILVDRAEILHSFEQVLALFSGKTVQNLGQGYLWP